MEKVLALKKTKIRIGIGRYEFAFYITASILIPFLLGHPQLLVGSVINMILTLVALNLSWKKALPIILLPSLAVALRGAVFGPFTVFLLYLTPFIWLGNSLFVGAIKKFKRNNVVAVVLSSLLKAGFLYLSAFLLFKLGVIPKIFLTAMGVFQLYTALIGGSSALLIMQSIGKKYGNN